MNDDERRYLFEELCGEAEWASQCWRLYKQLFGNRKHVQVMQKTALRFFGVHQRLLRDGIVLSVQKLLDPAISRGKRSASLEMLLHGLPRRADATVTRRLRKRLDAMRRNCTDIEEWRNREVAHLDLPTVLIQAPLPPVRLRAVDLVIKHIAEFLNDFAGEFYPDVIHVVEEAELDGDTLIFLLEESLARQRS